MLNILMEKYCRLENNNFVENRVEEERFCKKILLWMLLIWNVFWLFIPLFVIPGVYFDVLENIEWGRYWQFGYDKHPFVSMWITRFFYDLTGTASVMYILNQISISCAVVCVWLLSRKFLRPLSALAAALMPLTLQYYSSWALEFNNDVIAISVWGAAALFYYNALDKQHVKDWLLTAFFCAFALMTKYYAVVLLVSMAFALIAHKKGRQSFKHIGIYLAAILFILLITPNLIFLIQNDFMPFKYAAARSVSGKYSGFWISRIMNELDLLRVILSRLAFFIAAYLLVFFRSRPRMNMKWNFSRLFVAIVGLGPLGITLLFPLLTGGNIKPTWLASCLSLLALLLFMFLRPVVTRRSIYMLTGLIWIFGLALALEFAFYKGIRTPYYKSRCGYEVFPGKPLGEKISKIWRRKYATPLKYVIANRNHGCNIAFFADDNPSAFYFADTKISPWVKTDSVAEAGGVIVWEIRNSSQENKLPEFVDNLGESKKRVILLPPIQLERLTTPWARMIMKRPAKAITMGVALLPPEKL